MSHVPVMMREVVDALQPRDGGRYVDGTFGGGGYTTAMLDRADCQVIAIDRDPDAIAAGQALAERYAPRLRLIEGRFGDMAGLLGAEGVDDGRWCRARSRRVVDAVRSRRARLLLPRRRSARHAHGKARPLGGRSREPVRRERARRHLLALRRGAQEPPRRPRHRRAARKHKRIETTGELADIVRRAVGAIGRDESDPATRVFQALRIAVNDELGELERGLAAAEQVLAPGGRMAVVSFHSLEDRAVKEFVRARAGRTRARRAMRRRAPRRKPPPCAISRAGRWRRRRKKSPPIRAPARRGCASPRRLRVTFGA